MATDSLQIFGTAYTGVTGIKATDNNNTIKTYIRPQGTKSISANGNEIDVTEYASVNVAVPTGIDCPIFTITRDESTDEITAITCNKTHYECEEYTHDYNYSVVFNDTLYDIQQAGNASRIYENRIVYYASDDIAFLQVTYYSNNTITWVEGPIVRRSSSDLTASNLTVTAPAGYYQNAATKTLSDQNLIAGNIKNNVSIFGVTGSYSGAGIDCPIFTMVSNGGDPSSISCNKTYAECFAVINTNHIYIGSAKWSDESNYFDAVFYDYGENTELIYDLLSAGGVPMYRIYYQTNGTITWEDGPIPYRYSADLTANNLTVTAPAGYYYEAASKTLTDSNLSAGNIKNGVSIFGVTGSYTGTSPNLQAKTNIAPSTSSQTIEPDNGYDGLSSVQINAMPSLTLPTSTSASATSGYTSKATISRSTSDQYINIPTGYNSTSAYYKVSAIANGSAVGPTSLSATSATVTTGTNTITLTKTGVTTTPTVSAGYVSAASTTTATVTLTASVTTKAATTYHPSSSDQTISSGTYTTGTQTFKAVTVSGLSADKILSGTTIKIGDSTDDDCITSVSGSVVIQHYYTGSSAPSSSTGENGDIYLKTS